MDGRLCINTKRLIDGAFGLQRNHLRGLTHPCAVLVLEFTNRSVCRLGGTRWRKCCWYEERVERVTDRRRVKGRRRGRDR